MKTCTKCGRNKPIKEFYSNGRGGNRADCCLCVRAQQEAYRQSNRDRVNELTRKRRAADPDKFRKRRRDYYQDNKERVSEYNRWWFLAKKYGISRKEYQAILAEQRGVCAICGVEPNGKHLAVDHDHGNGEVRGLLCTRCNTTLERIEGGGWLDSALDYLRQSPRKEVE